MKLLGLGDNVFDAYAFRGEWYPGGNAANVSVLAKRAGAELVGYLGVLADDAPGRHYHTALEEEEIDLSRLRVAQGRSPCNYITLDAQGDRIFSGNNGPNTVQNMFAPVLTREDRIYAAEYTVIHTSIHSNLDSYLGGLAQHSRISMDFSNDGFTHGNVERLAPVLSFAFFSAGDRTPEQVRDFAAYASGCGIGQVIFTEGARGACGYANGVFWQTDACPVKPVDTLGAGDAFIAAFLVAFCENGERAREAAVTAAAFAAKCCLHYGAFGHPLAMKEGAR